MSRSTERWSEKYMKKLIGRADVDDALKRLDKLTHEEARMATSEVLKATHKVDDRVRGVSDQVAGVDDRVAGVAAKVSEVVDGTQSIFDRSSKGRLDHRETRRERSEGSHATNSRRCRPNETFVVS